MDINLIFTTNLILLSLAIYAITFVFRTILDYVLKTKKKSPLYRDVVLPLFPVITGFGFGFIHTFGFLAAITAGLFSGLIYRVVKSMIAAKEIHNGTKD